MRCTVVTSGHHGRTHPLHCVIAPSHSTCVWTAACLCPGPPPAFLGADGAGTSPLMLGSRPGETSWRGQTIYIYIYIVLYAIHSCRNHWLEKAFSTSEWYHWQLEHLLAFPAPAVPIIFTHNTRYHTSFLSAHLISFCPAFIFSILSFAHSHMIIILCPLLCPQPLSYC